MLKHLVYLKYVLRHKWFVLVACLRYGIVFRGIVHDFSKFKPLEWFAYAEWFYGGWRQDNYAGESVAPSRLKDAYDLAWNHHMKSNDHHWQWWIMTFDSGEVKVLPMSHAARKEMLADWIGAGRALGKPKIWEWYEVNKDKITLHPETRAWIEEQLTEMKRYHDSYKRAKGMGII